MAVPVDARRAFVEALRNDRADVAEQSIRQYPSLVHYIADAALALAATTTAAARLALRRAAAAAAADAAWISLNVAAYFGSERCVEMLLRHGADASRKSYKGKTAEDVAREYNKPGTASLLRAHAEAKASSSSFPATSSTAKAPPASTMAPPLSSTAKAPPSPSPSASSTAKAPPSPSPSPSSTAKAPPSSSAAAPASVAGVLCGVPTLQPTRISLAAPPPVAAVAAQPANRAMPLLEGLPFRALRFPPDFVPPKNWIDQLRLYSVGPLTQMQTIVEDSQCIADQLDPRVPGGARPLTPDSLFAFVIYTFDLGTATTCLGVDNFYYQLNIVLRQRQPELLMPLQSFLWHFKEGWSVLPPVHNVVCYRGVPASSREKLEEYKLGTRIHWSGITSTSLSLEKALRFATSEGPGGCVFIIRVVDGRNIARYSAVPIEDEVLLSPNSSLLVTETLTALPAPFLDVLRPPPHLVATMKALDVRVLALIEEAKAAALVW